MSERAKSGRVPSDPTDPASYAAPGGECDLVLKGGITSGVVYPGAVCELARRFRLRSVGGSSAGAIAAAAAAAAEHGRQRGGADARGFPGLAMVPGELAGDADGRSRLFRLFEPNRATKGLFGVLAAAIFEPPREDEDLLECMRAHWREPLALLQALWRRATHGLFRSRLRKVLPVSWALARAFPGWTLASFAPLFFGVALLQGLALHGSFPSGLAGLFFGALWLVPAWLVIAGALLWFGVRPAAAATLAENGYGLTTGWVPPERTPHAPLCAWLATLLDELAGKAPGEPLTFGDLAAADVELRVLTTDLTRGRPYAVPFADAPAEARELAAKAAPQPVAAGADEPDPDSFPDSRSGLYWVAEELEHYLPPDVIAWMRSHSRIFAEARIEGRLLALRTLPETEVLPVVFAARLSLSFPLLISAVPLYRPAPASAPFSASASASGDGGEAEGDPVPAPEADRPPRRWERCWFSDGGIASNLPVHFFDSPLPTRPTFAINLRETERLTAEPCDNVYLPVRPRSLSIGGVGEFLRRVIGTMQDWADELQVNAPGYRERVATLEHSAEEGGLNLDMPPELVATLSERGACAGRAFLEQFDWAEHRWVRFRTSMRLLQHMNHVVGSRFGDDLSERIASSPTLPIPTKTQQDEARRVVDRVTELGRRDARKHNPFGAEHAADAPQPAPVLRIAPDP